MLIYQRSFTGVLLETVLKTFCKIYKEKPVTKQSLEGVLQKKLCRQISLNSQEGNFNGVSL